MGCSSSKRDDFVSNKNNPLTPREILSRIESSNESEVFSIAKINMRYAWVSQRGYYPDALNKANQDAYMIIPRFGNFEDQAFFGIFDGHGKDGHHCARYARDNLHKRILEKLASQPRAASSEAIRQALTQAHLAVNTAMHREKMFDDSLSGTTSISLLMRGRTMFISNVGDSRAIIVSMGPEGRLVARNLSSDQTPYRKDERLRIKKTGARVLSMDQIEGIEPYHENWGDLSAGDEIDEGGDPPRVWSANGNFPGTAFTRSLGDLFAEECGVIAEPEIEERDIEPQDKYIVIASDGVFEFLTNQMVADILHRYTDPLEACKAVVQTSYDMWLQYEVRTDDISIVAFYIDSYGNSDGLAIQEGDGADSSRTRTRTHSGTAAAASATTAGGAAATSGGAGGGGGGSNSTAAAAAVVVVPSSVETTNKEERPVRRAMSRAKRNMIQIHNDDDDYVDAALTPQEIALLVVPKNELDEALINSAIKSNFLFQHLSAVQRQDVIAVMKPVDVVKDEFVIKQGDKGNLFYVVDSGKYEVRVVFNPEHISTIDVKNPTSAGNVVHVYDSGPDHHPGFGELSLMYGKPRAASVIAVGPGRLWSLDRRIFKRVVLRPTDARKNVIRVLKKVALFASLNFTQMQRLTDLLNEAMYNAGDYIITQGEQGDSFYIIEHGQCDCTINIPANDINPVATSKVVLHLKDHDYFGERALLEAKPRAANVIARMPTKVLYITKRSFEEVLGPLSRIIDEDRRHREALAMIAMSKEIPKSFQDVKMIAVVTNDASSSLILGSFNSDIPNISIRSFILSTTVHSESIASVSRCAEAAKIITASSMVINSQKLLVPRNGGIFRESNAIHILFQSAIVSDLSSLLRNYSEKFTYNLEVITFTISCIVSALETIHSLGIIYRAVQPESLYVDSLGRIVLLDFRVCKLGAQGGAFRTFTVCGVSDYLAPEQISQTGHGFTADWWSLGVLLCELATGQHPFSSNSEVATYAKISSFGSAAFPTLKFPENVSPEIREMATALLTPSAERRLGASGVSAVKSHPFFAQCNPALDWERIALGSVLSPLAQIAVEELEEISKERVDQSILDSFSAPFDDASVMEVLDTIRM